jgi:hypothetical protein
MVSEAELETLQNSLSPGSILRIAGTKLVDVLLVGDVIGT